MILSFTCRLVIFIIAFVFTTGRTSGQTLEFFHQATNDQIDRCPEVDEFKSRIGKNPNIAGYVFVTLNPLAQSQKDGILTLKIPGNLKDYIPLTGIAGMFQQALISQE